MPKIYIDEAFHANNTALRSIYKWWLDLMRNVAVVAAIQYFAAKSGTWLMWGLSGVSYFALWGYIYSYFEEITVDFFPKLKRPWLRRLVFVVVGVAVTTPFFFVVSLGLYDAVDQIAKIQGH